jgi:hypothetical protein
MENIVTKQHDLNHIKFPYCMQLQFVSSNNNTTGATRGAESAYPSGEPEFTPGS